MENQVANATLALISAMLLLLLILLLLLLDKVTWADAFDEPETAKGVGRRGIVDVAVGKNVETPLMAEYSDLLKP